MFHFPLLLIFALIGSIGFSSPSTASAASCRYLLLPMNPDLVHALKQRSPTQNLGQPQLLKDAAALKKGDVFFRFIRGTESPQDYWVVENAEQIEGEGLKINARKLYSNVQNNRHRGNYNPQGKVWDFYQKGPQARDDVTGVQIGTLPEFLAHSQVKYNPLKSGDIFSALDLDWGVHDLQVKVDGNSKPILIPNKEYVTLNDDAWNGRDSRYFRDPSRSEGHLYVQSQRSSAPLRVDALDRSRGTARFMVLKTETIKVRVSISRNSIYGLNAGIYEDDVFADVHGVWARRLSPEGKLVSELDATANGEALGELVFITSLKMRSKLFGNIIGTQAKAE